MRGAATRLGDWVARRAAGEPVAYIRGFKEWLSLRVATDSRALIPRPRRSSLAEAAISEIAARLVRDDATVLAWEVATGGGAVALAIALRLPRSPRPRPAAARRRATSPPRRSSWRRRTWRLTASAGS